MSQHLKEKETRLSSKKQQSRSLRGTSRLMRIERTLSSNTKSNLKQRCVIIGSYLVNVNSKIIVLLLMEIMNSWRKYTYQQISRRRHAFSSTPHSFVHMGAGVSSYTHREIYIILREHSTTQLFWMRMLDYRNKEMHCWKIMKSLYL